MENATPKKYKRWSFLNCPQGPLSLHRRGSHTFTLLNWNWKPLFRRCLRWFREAVTGAALSSQRTESFTLPGLLLLDYTRLLSYLPPPPPWGRPLCRGCAPAVSWLTSRQLWWICSRAACDSLHVSGTERGQVGDQMQADRKCVAASACSNRNSSARSPRLPTLPPPLLSLCWFIWDGGRRGKEPQRGASSRWRSRWTPGVAQNSQNEELGN